MLEPLIEVPAATHVPRGDVGRHRGIERRLEDAPTVDPREPLTEQFCMAVGVGMHEGVPRGRLLPHPEPGPLVLEPLIEVPAATHVLRL